MCGWQTLAAIRMNAILASGFCLGFLGASIALAADPPLPDNQPHLEFLAATARTLLEGCRVKAQDGTVLYTPDGKGNYKALWTRDFTYMVENAGDLMPAAEIEAGIRYLLRGQREDGAMPDRVRPDGVAVYVAGPEDHPLGQANLDNPMFMVLLVHAHLQRLAPADQATRFREWVGQLDRGLEWVPLSPRGLVYNSIGRPHSPYGFTDTVAKTGELLFESLLFWQACEAMAASCKEWGRREQGAKYRQRARTIEVNLGELWDKEAGAFLAASIQCRQVDVWGNAYAVAIDFPLGSRRKKVELFLADNYDNFVWRGQVRHLLNGEYWERLLTPVPKDRYQNGAYWATASGWLMQALAKRRPDLAQRTLDHLVSDFRQHGVCECVNEGYRQLESYVVSATNPLAAARRLFAPPERR